jgi:hypothetical protein
VSDAALSVLGVRRRLSVAGIRHRFVRRWCLTPPYPPLVADTAFPPLVSDAVSSTAGGRCRLLRRLVSATGAKKSRPACTPDGSVFLC